ncbi:Protein of unknown function (DUF2424) [Geosmithia morbida]|uniref:Alpha/beta hydrolase fold-3 domain-containing protein n=1 Tax=Geosmithia morbida TaxID=1094350 RepID=A0A9P5D4U1_9HYPO|nr:Protein of unknown function (DUF2424) [Geosmithia morbida]KAF4123110.1 Protein of unknown function (DUF2424) [Geosmithia morbida]
MSQLTEEDSLQTPPADDPSALLGRFVHPVQLHQGVHRIRRLHRPGLRRLEGIWVTHDPDRQPDVVVYYVHGGGFALGSTYFYLEFQMALNSLLVDAGYNNPAIFSVEYTLVPDGLYPMQLNEIIRGYEHILRVAGDASRVCVAGDSAGGTLVLSLLQVLGNTQTRGPSRKDVELLDASTAIAHGTTLPIPGMATLISPWVTLMSSTLFSPSGADYLDPRTLRLYARKYAGESGARRYPASPGSCDEEQVWRSSSPGRGYFVIYGEDEVFASDIENFVRIQERLGVEIRTEKVEARVHAWPVVSLFASSTEDARLGGLRSIVDEIRNRI